jgi:tetraprenyl-beta-curcumene synthase
MTTAANRLLTARMSLALVVANARYWSTVAPLVQAQLDRWTRHAARIPDPTLQAVAVLNLREEGFNAQATATLATLAPRKYRKPAVEAIVGLQVIYDYLDSLIERPLTDPLGNGRQLYQALVDAVALDMKPRDDYYARNPESDDGGYLRELVSVVRGALGRLPCLAATTEVSRHAAERCAEAQVHAHATSVLSDTQLELWATRNAAGTGLEWREFLAGAVSSGLALHALTVAAADPRSSREQALVIDEIYLSVCALTTLLDGLIDYEQDMQSMGHPGYVRLYEDQDALAQGLRSVIDLATRSTRDAPNGAHHLMMLVGVAAYYASAPTASSAFARPVTEQVRQELRPLITPTLAIMRSWRGAKCARTAITSRASR